MPTEAEIKEKKRRKRRRDYEAWRLKHPKLPPREPIVSANGRLCRTCGERKSNDQFQKDDRAKDGLAWRCRTCARKAHKRWSAVNIERVRDHGRGTQRAAYANDPEKLRATLRRSRLKTKYGLTLEELAARIAEQGGGCAICCTELALRAPRMKKANVACVDHDHSNGRTRGILCSSCNRGLGLLKDDVEILASAISYLLRYRE